MKVYRIAKLFMFGVGFSFLFGCVHSSNHTRGSVALKHSDMEADICLGAGEVAVGDRLTIYRNQCSASEDGGLHAGGGKRRCSKIKIGEGQVINVLNEHYSTMKVSPGMKFSEGSIVEKVE